jgi:hypothetical protein
MPNKISSYLKNKDQIWKIKKKYHRGWNWKIFVNWQTIYILKNGNGRNKKIFVIWKIIYILKNSRGWNWKSFIIL